MPSHRQTQSYLIRRFEEAGIHPEVRHGQNFLIDLNLLDVLLDAADIGPRDVVLEVGTGLGSLTQRMAERAAAVVTVEIDHRMFQLASEELIDLDNVVMLKQDALKNKNNMDPAVLEAVREQLAGGPNRQFKLAANLPYNVATPILSNLLTFEPTPKSLTATIQKELAERICAPPGTKDYSALSIWMQALCDRREPRTTARYPSGCRPCAISKSCASCRLRFSGPGQRFIRRSFILFRMRPSDPVSPTWSSFISSCGDSSCIAASFSAACW